ncbi:phage tail protein [Oceanidesulfovibrio marinus]|uniref:Phage Tail Collar Domain n=1 Tax=Oceanidesulfovibrio marinus TaxID=370038 RepID=A0ABX6NJ29_9BACT|nr:phage tail protein [Oceanidesulfovibrio marinus]QJT10221.1 hypothetical protein E8L03_15355 [Oceanidesulfovibrio marinus]
MTLDYENFKIEDGKTPLNAETFNDRFYQLVRRLHALEQLKVTWDKVVAETTNYGLTRINEAVQPLVDGLAADMQALLDEGQAVIDAVSVHADRQDNPHQVMAGQVPYDNDASALDAATIQAAVDALADQLLAHAAQQDNPHGVSAGQVPYDNSMSDLQAATLQAAVDTLAAASTSLAAALNGLTPADIGALAATDAVGTVRFVPGRNALPGTLKLNGGAYSRTVYADLWAYAQGSGNLAASEGAKQAGQFGPGNGSTTFTLPDARGMHIRVWDDGRGVDSGRAIGSYQADAILTHRHVVTVRGYTASNGSNAMAVSGGSSYASSTATTNTGGSENRVKTIAWLACIKY